MDVVRTIAQINNLSVPGFLRDGTFLREQDISTFIQYRSVNLDANEDRSFKVDFPCTIDTIIVQDLQSSAKYDFKVTTPEGFIWNISIPSAMATNYGSTKIVTFPDFVLDRGSTVSIRPEKALNALVIFVRLAFNVDIEEF